LQSDLRTDRDVISGLAKSGRAPVSSDQALSFSRQMSAALYVETSAKLSSRSAISAFEVAGLASMGKLAPRLPAVPPSAASTPSPEASLKKQRFSGTEKEEVVVESSEHFWQHFQFGDDKRRSTSEARTKEAAIVPRTPNLSSSSRCPFC
jgi:hypothetical protein